MRVAERLYRRLAEEERTRFLTLQARLAALRPAAALTLNRNRRILISLRGGGRRPIVLSVHPALLAHDAALDDLPGWVARGGRGTTPAMRVALDQAGQHERSRAREEAPVVLEPLQGPLDLVAEFAAVHARFFPQLPRPAVAWARPGPRGRRRHLRFGSYRRHPPQVLLSPRLNQPWVAREFVRFVLYHELVHHALALDPRPGETAHSPRFRALERRYPDWERLHRWERQQLDRFLASPAEQAPEAPRMALAAAREQLAQDSGVGTLADAANGTK